MIDRTRPPDNRDLGQIIMDAGFPVFDFGLPDGLNLALTIFSMLVIVVTIVAVLICLAHKEWKMALQAFLGGGAIILLAVGIIYAVKFIILIILLIVVIIRAVMNLFYRGRYKDGKDNDDKF